MVKVDLIIRKEADCHREAFERRRRIRIEGYDLCVITPEDLIVSKLDWARDPSRGPGMTDTDPEIADVYRRMLLERSSEERLRMAGSMGETARAFARPAVLAGDPSASSAAVREAIFLRF